MPLLLRNCPSYALVTALAAVSACEAPGPAIPSLEYREVESGIAPYPDSPLIMSIAWDTATALETGAGNPAPGSDQFRATWAMDGNLYVSWGDGGGFGGSNNDGRVSLGVGMVSGTPPQWEGTNIWGGVDDASDQANVEGKPMGLLGVGSALYLWMVRQPGFDASGVHISNDNGVTWALGEYNLVGKLRTFTPIQFGQGYTGVPKAYDGYAVGYMRNNDRTALGLARVPLGAATDDGAYEVFTGTDADGIPQWSAVLDDAADVFADATNEINWGFMSAYNPYFDRYFLNANHGGDGEGAGFGVFISENPWGPWETVFFTDEWLDGFAKFTPQFINKWSNPDGTGWLIYSGWPEYDGYFHIQYALDGEPVAGTTTASPETSAGSMGDDAQSSGEDGVGGSGAGSASGADGTASAGVSATGEGATGEGGLPTTSEGSTGAGAADSTGEGGCACSARRQRPPLWGLAAGLLLLCRRRRRG